MYNIRTFIDDYFELAVLVTNLAKSSQDMNAFKIYISGTREMAWK